ncbi:glucose-6-phosphate isomerase [Paenarthrobacter sp. AT5]|uniref:glucose-6-phosphate isomerase n=1 Tax=Paenarthrobacter TaxID=1742992 RepID=UPI001A9809BB|nr:MULTISPECIES: glucose-6-phosphate isomerase [Paenarthrobacter]QSZ52678.1 glucose-6-phosphate isomerase [Paenarthrobacter ureafaciens]WOC60536.1 glucose-6-phosphate isomerase [Paenarthrobacter sp. AT5]
MNTTTETTPAETTVQAVLTDFDVKTGLSTTKAPLQRRLSAMADMYADQEAAAAQVAKDDVLVYEFFDMGVPSTPGDVAYGTSITYPGKVGDEYYMTKGHFHEVLDTAEIYYCLSGNGYMLMENPEGDWQAAEFKPGQAVYVPRRYAHRSINISATEPLVTFFAFPGHAGHDYGTIETKGFRKLCVERDGKPEFIDNPRWQA